MTARSVRAVGWLLVIALWMAVIVPVLPGRLGLFPAAVLLTLAMIRRHRDLSELVGFGIGLGLVALVLGFVFSRYEPCSDPALNTPSATAPDCGFFDPTIWFVGGAMLLGAAVAAGVAGVLDARASR